MCTFQTPIVSWVPKHSPSSFSLTPLMRAEKWLSYDSNSVVGSLSMVIKQVVGGFWKPQRVIVYMCHAGMAYILHLNSRVILSPSKENTILLNATLSTMIYMISRRIKVVWHWQTLKVANDLDGCCPSGAGLKVATSVLEYPLPSPENLHDGANP